MIYIIFHRFFFSSQAKKIIIIRIHFIIWNGLCSNIENFLFFCIAFLSSDQGVIKGWSTSISKSDRLTDQGVICWPFLIRVHLKKLFKNTAHGRQSISRPIRIVAQILKYPVSKAKFFENQTFFERKFDTLYEQKFSNPLVFRKDSVNLKSLDSGVLEMGAKKNLNRVNKGEKICNIFFLLRPF